MPQWGNTDVASNSVFWGPALFNKVANTSNQTALFGNTTADAFVTGETIGQFGADAGETQAAREASVARPAHAGWVIKTEGSGGRTGRVTYETLVAMGSLGGDSEDVVLPDYTIRINTQPANTTANTTAAQNATFSVSAVSVPTGATLSYAWTYANGTTIQAGANVGPTTGATLTVNSAVQTVNAAFRVTVSTTGGAANVVSSNATLRITT